MVFCDYYCVIFVCSYVGYCFYCFLYVLVVGVGDFDEEIDVVVKCD